MNKEEILKKLFLRHKECVELMLLVKDEKVKSQLYGETVGIEYAVGLIDMMEEQEKWL